MDLNDHNSKVDQRIRLKLSKSSLFQFDASSVTGTSRIYQLVLAFLLVIVLVLGYSIGANAQIRDIFAERDSKASGTDKVHPLHAERAKKYQRDVVEQMAQKPGNAMLKRSLEMMDNGTFAMPGQSDRPPQRNIRNIFETDTNPHTIVNFKDPEPEAERPEETHSKDPSCDCEF